MVRLCRRGQQKKKGGKRKYKAKKQDPSGINGLTPSEVIHFFLSTLKRNAFSLTTNVFLFLFFPFVFYFYSNELLAGQTAQVVWNPHRRGSTLEICSRRQTQGLSFM